MPMDSESDRSMYTASSSAVGDGDDGGAAAAAASSSTMSSAASSAAAVAPDAAAAVLEDEMDNLSNSPLYSSDPAFSSDYYESLDLSFDDIADTAALATANANTEADELLYPTCKKNAASSNWTEAEDLNHSYILGTLVVRVVAARNVSTVDSPGLAQTVGGILFGGGGGGGGGTRGSLRGSSSSANVNPYASVRFGSTTQRTSQVFGTTDPIWPRTEAMYLDVTHPPPPPSAAAAASQSDDEMSNPASTRRSSSTSSTSSNSINNNNSSHRSPATARKEALLEQWRIDPPLLTVGVFHSNSDMNSVKKPQKYASGDSNDIFLGMATINLTHLLTGKSRFDEWLPLSGGSKDHRNNKTASIRLVCEYEPSDPPPHPGDIVQFTRFCRPVDLYPLSPFGNTFVVEEGCNNHDLVVLSHTSREGWVSTFLAHRFMLLVVERHYGAMDMYQEEMLSIAQRLSHSPMINVVQESWQRLDDEGLVHLGASAVQGGLSVLNRWFHGGVETVAQDLAFATNWDGRFNPDPETSLATNDDSPTAAAASASPFSSSSETVSNGMEEEDQQPERPALPNMPSCPITQEPMRDPVVAADGHTYERSAIVRWLQTSDKSPLTGSVLPHKNLVPNYMLLSSLQEQASYASSSSISANIATTTQTQVLVETVTEESDMEEEDTTDVAID